MVHWAWLIAAVMGGVFLGVFGTIVARLLIVVRTPPRPFLDHSMAKWKRKNKGFVG